MNKKKEIADEKINYPKDPTANSDLHTQSRRPTLPAPQATPESWFMVQKENGLCALCDSTGTEMMELYEPLHPDEITAIASVFTQLSQKVLDQGKRMERKRILEIVARL